MQNNQIDDEIEYDFDPVGKHHLNEVQAGVLRIINNELMLALLKYEGQLRWVITQLRDTTEVSAYFDHNISHFLFHLMLTSDTVSTSSFKKHFYSEQEIQDMASWLSYRCQKYTENHFEKPT